MILPLRGVSCCLSEEGDGNSPEGEEVANLLLAGLRTDVLDVDGVGGHDV